MNKIPLFFPPPLLNCIKAPLSKAVNQPLQQSSVPEINAVELRAVVWTCKLPSMSPDPLPRAAAVNKQQTQSTYVEMNKLHIEVCFFFQLLSLLKVYMHVSCTNGQNMIFFPPANAVIYV